MSREKSLARAAKRKRFKSDLNHLKSIKIRVMGAEEYRKKVTGLIHEMWMERIAARHFLIRPFAHVRYFFKYRFKLKVREMRVSLRRARR